MAILVICSGCGEKVGCAKSDPFITCPGKSKTTPSCDADYEKIGGGCPREGVDGVRVEKYTCVACRTKAMIAKPEHSQEEARA